MIAIVYKQNDCDQEHFGWHLDQIEVECCVIDGKREDSD